MSELAELAREAIDAWDGRLEQALFGTDDPEEISATLGAFVEPHLGGAVDSIFYVQGVGLVVGLDLGDKKVVLKVHRWNTSVELLTAMQQVQVGLADKGIRIPRPLLAVQPLGHGLVTVEEHLAGDRADGRTPETRRTMATGLHRLLEATADLDADVGRAPMLRPPGAPLWSEPHSVRFDFDATTEGAAWIDDFGDLARTRLDAVALPDRIGHLDWRVQNLGFDDGAIAAIYDCDSLAKAPEPVVVGAAAGCFCIDWDAGVEDPPPTPDEMRAFVADYELARGAPFDEEEREALDAANLMLIAYGARSQHSDLFLQPELGDTSAVGWFRLLRDRGERCF